LTFQRWTREKAEGIERNFLRSIRHFQHIASQPHADFLVFAKLADPIEAVDLIDKTVVSEAEPPPVDKLKNSWPQVRSPQFPMGIHFLNNPSIVRRSAEEERDETKTGAQRIKNEL